MKRITMVALAIAAGATTACRDLGLEGNIPLEEARDREPSALVAAVMRPTEVVAQRIVVDGRLWVPSGQPITAGAEDLQPVGSADGTTVYARRWDRPPYDAVFIRLAPAGAPGRPPAAGIEEHWVELMPVRGRSGPVPGASPRGPADTAAHGSAAGTHGGH